MRHEWSLPVLSHDPDEPLFPEIQARHDAETCALLARLVPVAGPWPDGV